MFLLSSILENSHIGYLRNTAEVLPFQISFFWTTDSLFIPFIALCCLWWWIFYSSSSMSRIHVKFSIIVLIFFLFGSVLPGNYSSWCGWNEVEIVTNSFLSNYLNKIHPPLFFIVFSFTLFCKFTPPSTIQRFYPIKLLNTIMLAAFLTMLGGWWAFQEGTWGGWWNWDSSEVLALVLGLISVFFLHFYTIHHLFSKELALEAWKCDIWSLPPLFSIVQLSFIQTSHSFGISFTHLFSKDIFFLTILIVSYLYLLFKAIFYWRYQRILTSFNPSYPLAPQKVTRRMWNYWAISTLIGVIILTFGELLSPLEPYLPHDRKVWLFVICFFFYFTGGHYFKLTFTALFIFTSGKL